jgi:hypothetical protein
VDERLGTDDGKNLKDRRNPAVYHDQKPAIDVRKPDAVLEPAPQNSQRNWPGTPAAVKRI